MPQSSATSTSPRRERACAATVAFKPEPPRVRTTEWNLWADLRVPRFYDVDTHFVEELRDRELDMRIEVDAGRLFPFAKG